jgi:hypothetical protein
MMMMGGRMTYAFDAAGGRAVGSVIKMGGSFLGIRLAVEEVVIERQPPHHKAWETVGQPRMIVISRYRMRDPRRPTGAPALVTTETSCRSFGERLSARRVRCGQSSRGTSC